MRIATNVTGILRGEGEKILQGLEMRILEKMFGASAVDRLKILKRTEALNLFVKIQ